MRSRFLLTAVFALGGFSGWMAASGRLADLFTREQTTAAKGDGSVLPFPPTPSASVAGPTVRDSKMAWRKEPDRLKPGAPNVLIVLIDDVGFGTPDTFGGECRTPTLTKLKAEGVCYNTFHTTSICSPTRAALLTGRNHHRVGNGTIAERASDFDGYTGTIPKTAATVPEVLHHYGYRSAAFGKWHNTPANQTTAMGPFDRWPTGHGFDHFYGFLAGETSQWEPRLYENVTPIEPPRSEKYHLTEDMVEKGLAWLKRHQAFAPDKPFFMYWAPGAAHGPHHIFKEWADKYKGRFDDGWDKYRERVFARQTQLGWVPKGTKLTPRPDTLAAWDSIPEAERPFQRRLMEVFAGFVEHTDAQVGKLVDGMERLGLRENTIILYAWGDNGSSAEGQKGTVSELLAQNNVPNTVQQQLAALDRVGGVPALGGPKVDSMYHAGWAWAGCTPFRSTKLVAAHFGGTRNPLVVTWPKGIKPDAAPRPQFHHVNDIAPTLYEVIGVRPPDEVNGFKQDPIDGVSFAYTFADATAAGRKRTQYFENNGSRGVYHDGWFAGTFGPLVPWDTAGSAPTLKAWDANQDVWELYDLTNDFSQANDVAAKEPARLAAMKALFLSEAKANKALPIGGGLWTRLHPEDAVGSPYTSWRFDATSVRMPEFTAPPLGKRSTHVTADVEVGKGASGVLYALGGASGGVTLYMDKGQLVYEYNMLIIERTTARSDAKIAPGKHRIEVVETIARPGAPADVVLKVDGKGVAKVTVKRTVPGAFTASETLDVGADLGSPVSLEYFDRAPFKFDGTIEKIVVESTAPVR
ncbi:arylsulfatase [Frigoriglobus tundricola]|uniref:Arylsulfatase n=1 Tax=Frigoriglobus tundricola TaxID=2774151 RepID=A0A6M5YZB4_9BACT|nr:arylsulfatase [Frigoriglobus tundricola]QJW98571.1 Arylsulfatase [Frigoriglobus tundricola]